MSPELARMLVAVERDLRRLSPEGEGRREREPDPQATHSATAP